MTWLFTLLGKVRNSVPLPEDLELVCALIFVLLFGSALTLAARNRAPSSRRYLWLAAFLVLAAISFHVFNQQRIVSRLTPSLVRTDIILPLYACGHAEDYWQDGRSRRGATLQDLRTVQGDPACVLSSLAAMAVFHSLLAIIALSSGALAGSLLHGPLQPAIRYLVGENGLLHHIRMLVKALHDLVVSIRAGKRRAPKKPPKKPRTRRKSPSTR